MNIGDKVRTRLGVGIITGFETARDSREKEDVMKRKETGRVEITWENPPFSYNPSYHWKHEILEIL